jgi:hypothetical protein
MKKTLVISLLIALGAPLSSAQAQQNPDAIWRPFAYLVGEWIGDGQGAPGESSGSATFSFDLEKHVMIRKNHAVIRAANGQPTGVHDDLMTIYPEPGRGMRALYIDNESHVIHYDVRPTATGDTIEFISDKQPGAMRFRLVYIRTGERTTDVGFDMAMPNAPDAFKRYITGNTVKK